MTREIQPYGSWPSPVTAEVAAGKSLRFGSLMADGDAVYWSESRPAESGRGVIMRASAGGATEEVLPAPWSVRSRVHEYGGGEFLAVAGRVWFVEADSQDIYEIVEGRASRRVTDAPGVRFADITFDAARNRLICVAERAGEGEHAYPENFLCVVPLDGSDAGKVKALVSGEDFYASPRLSPDGGRLAWLSWDLPHMPWEAAALHIATIDGDGGLGEPVRIAGGDGSAVFQPGWSTDGQLDFVWDRSGWGNLYAWDGDTVRVLEERKAELLRPLWVFHMQSWTRLADGRIAAAWLEQGALDLRLFDTGAGSSHPIKTRLRSIDAMASFGNGLAVLGTGDYHAPSIMALDLEAGEARVLRAGMEADLSPDDIAVGEVIDFESEGESVHALYYPPANAGYRAPEGERPPVIMMAHGGPTGSADRGLKIKIQYWTSRGFGVCDVDYSGSAGYGTAYRRRLDGQWGLRDVADVVAAARYLGKRGLADPERLLISGGSAGGLTVLLALARYDIFAAGACSYGVCDMAQLQKITHKFEGGYLYALTGTTPQTCEAVFAERSPINMASDITAPVIFFQGSDDKVVPPEQTRSMARTLKANGVQMAFYEFEGEGHGFRRGETIEQVFQLEYAFYCEVLGITPGETLPKVALEGWSEAK